TASRSVLRFVPYSRARSRSGGRRVPAGSSPDKIRPRSFAKSASVRGVISARYSASGRTGGSAPRSVDRGRGIRNVRAVDGGPFRLLRALAPRARVRFDALPRQAGEAESAVIAFVREREAWVDQTPEGLRLSERGLAALALE